MVLNSDLHNMIRALPVNGYVKISCNWILGFRAANDVVKSDFNADNICTCNVKIG